MVLGQVVAHGLIGGQHGVDGGGGDDIHVDAVGLEGGIQVLQLVGKGQAGDKVNRDNAGLAGQLHGRGPGFLGIAAVVCPILVGGGSQLLHLVGGHAGEQIANPGVRDGVIKVVAQVAVHEAQLGGEVLVLVGRVDVVEVLVPLKALVVGIDPLVIAGDVGHQGGGGDVLAVQAGAHGLVQVGNAGLQNGLHVGGVDLELQVLNLVDKQGLLNVEDHGGVVKVKDHVLALVGVLVNHGLDAGAGSGGPVAGDELGGVGLVVGAGVDGRSVGSLIPGQAHVQRAGEIAQLVIVVAVVNIVSLDSGRLAVHRDLGGGGHQRTGCQRRRNAQAHGEGEPQSDQFGWLMGFHFMFPPLFLSLRPGVLRRGVSSGQSPDPARCFA